MEKLHKKAKKHVIDHYGNLLYPSKPRYNPITKTYVVNLNLHTPQPKTHQVNITENIGQITYNTKGEILKQPTKKEILQKLKQP